MSFDWGKFLEVAEKLNQQKSEETFRTAISRAYYSVFCTIRNLKGFKDYKQRDIHSKLIETLKNSHSNSDNFIGTTLDQLRRERNIADYNEDKIVNEMMSQKCIYMAQEIFKLIKK